MAEKQTNKERLKEITDSIEGEIKNLFQSEKYMRYLRTMSRFHRYSVNNQMLIYMQKPDATLVAGYNKWKDRFSRNVKQGEKSIRIIAPTPFKKKVEEAKLDPDTKLPMRDRDGNPIMEEKEVKIPMYKPVPVFDVSQTEGAPLPTLASELKGDVKNFEIFMEALRRSSPVPMEMKAMDANMDGYFSQNSQSIAIREGMSEVQTISAAVHEITHAKLHNYEQNQSAEKDTGKKDRRTEEVEAESVSFAVCAYYGIETGENSFGYIASWSNGKELPELRASLETINKTAGELIGDIDRNFAAICKERGIDFSQEQQEPCPDEQFYRVNKNQYLHVQRCDGGYDYTFYNAEDKSAGDGGQLDNPDLNIHAAARKICARHDLSDDTLSFVSCGLPEDFSASALALDTALDEYPMPDKDMGTDALTAYGFYDEAYLPVSQERAAELIERDFTVYAVSGDGTEMVFDRDEVETHPANTVFVVLKEEWEKSAAFKEAVSGRMERQPERETAFLDHNGDCFAIYQVKLDEPGLRDIRYQSMERLNARGQQAQRQNYELAYTAPLPEGAGLDTLWEKFNIDHPADYMRPSLSVSDIIAIKRDGVVSCHYVDSVGYAEVQGFLQPENYLKNAEMQLEDDYNMVDGIVNNAPKQPTVSELEEQVRVGQSISLMELAEAMKREQGEKKQPPRPKKELSVLEKLHRPLPPRNKAKAAPEKSAERGYDR